MKPMKILQVNKLYYPEMGGIEKTLRQLSEGLNSCPDVELEVLVCQKKGRKTREIVNGVQIVRSGSLGVLSSVPIAPFFVFDFRAMAGGKEVIQFHMPFPLGDLACLLSGYRGKVVVYWHSDVVKQKKWMFLYRPLMERFLKRADLILVGAQGILEGSGYLKPYRAKCRIVPFAVSNAVLEAGGRHLEMAGYHNKTEKINFLFIGRLVYYKGCAVLLEAFEKFVNERFIKAGIDHMDDNLTIVGDGPLREELEQKARAGGCSDRIRFLGAVDDERLQRAMEQADVFVLPSIEKSEAFGLVQLEAMAYGLPVINTSLPSGAPEVSIHGKTGLTVSPGDADELAEAMGWIAEHRKERQMFGRAARKRVEEKYTEKIMVERIKEIYERICGF